jgi:putative ABC transport system substrate-binding protein
MKRFVFTLGLVALMASLSTGTSNGQTPVQKVYISQTTRHPALDLTTQGILEGLKQEGFEAGKNLETQTECTQGNSALASQIATMFASKAPDITVAVGTLSAQSLAPYGNQGKLKLIFSSVTDPLGARLVKSLETPGGNITGVSNFIPLEPQLQLFKKLVPGLKRLGVLYNPGEPNSVSIVEKLEALCPQYDLVLVKQTLTKTSEAASSATQLASQVEALFISNDNTALSSINSILKATQSLKIPLFVSDTDAVAQGALAAIGPNQYDIGMQTGRMIARALRGEKLASMPVELPSQTELFLNQEAADQLGLTLPAALLKEAKKVVGSSVIGLKKK